MSELFVGLMSGTSVDGVDAVVAEFAAHRCRIVAATTYPYPEALRNRIEALIQTGRTELRELGALDVALGRHFGQCVRTLVDRSGLRPADIIAIGHHGQTIFHQPCGPEPFTMQIGDPNSIAAVSSIRTVADFRRLDVALGGQGAPLVPAFHAWLFATASTPRLIANIGGIANVTALVPGRPVIGFDTGPGNTLLDLWVARERRLPFDEGGGWAASGKIIPALLDRLLTDAYFEKPPPKSTGREHFNAAWLKKHMDRLPDPPAAADVQATLTELTAATLASAAQLLELEGAEMIVCGGGAHNVHLLERLRALHAGAVTSTSALGLDPDWVEAAAFAWLARARLRGEPGNVPTVTGARKAVVLGGLYSMQGN